MTEVITTNEEAPASTVSPISTESLEKLASSSAKENGAAVVFGSIPSIVYEALTSSVDKALVEGVSSLPLLPKRSEDDEGLVGEESLMEHLREAYQRNLSVAELYSHRNLFSLQLFRKGRRSKIIQAWLSGNDFTPKSETDTSESCDTTMDMPQPLLGKEDEIPSDEKIAAVDDENEALRKKVRQLKRSRNELLMKLERLSTTQSTASHANQALDGSNVGNVHALVSGAMMGREALENLETQGHDVSKRLDDVKRKRNDDEDNDDLALDVPSPKSKTLKEDYEYQRNMVRTTKEAANKVTLLFQKP
eukprot:CAMPEP_0198292488 /NCGR_PEP_ID=MMETSP1449-20131203/12237_1 /TAXON_ID=420275 /ORGANISM="Attheya septentrionalis, Strain CCMP2084" /LENGTH=305 /DNA_ID=CAMNT_0043991559 /DNA_START=43 /DNA_END=960 /DNA_ORIENTATION=+